MAEILPFARPEPKAPHLHGTAICLGCRYEWVGVSLVGTAEELECEACGCSKGVYKRFVVYGDELSWACTACQGPLFTAILLKGVPTIACATCGELRNAMDLFNT